MTNLDLIIENEINNFINKEVLQEAKPQLVRPSGMGGYSQSGFNPNERPQGFRDKVQNAWKKGKQWFQGKNKNAANGSNVVPPADSSNVNQDDNRITWDDSDVNQASSSSNYYYSDEPLDTSANSNYTEPVDISANSNYTEPVDTNSSEGERSTATQPQRRNDRISRSNYSRPRSSRYSRDNMANNYSDGNVTIPSSEFNKLARQAQEMQNNANFLQRYAKNVNNEIQGLSRQ